MIIVFTLDLNILSEEAKNEMKSLRMGVEKLQVEIEAKSHTIAALLLPSDDRLIIIRKLESELQEVKQAHRLVVEESFEIAVVAVILDEVDEPLEERRLELQLLEVLGRHLPELRQACLERILLA